MSIRKLFIEREINVTAVSLIIRFHFNNCQLQQEPSNMFETGTPHNQQLSNKKKMLEKTIGANAMH